MRTRRAATNGCAVGVGSIPLVAGLGAAIEAMTATSMAVRLAIARRHGVILKTVEKRWFNGLRISTHIFNTEADVDRALAAIAEEVG